MGCGPQLPNLDDYLGDVSGDIAEEGSPTMDPAVDMDVSAGPTDATSGEQTSAAQDEGGTTRYPTEEDAMSDPPDGTSSAEMSGTTGIEGTGSLETGSPESEDGPGDPVSPPPPPILDTAYIWLRADRGVHLEGGLVDAWGYVGQASIEVDQPTSSARPSVNVVSIAGHEAIRFSGSQSLRFNPLLSLEELTLFWVAQSFRVDQNNEFQLVLGPGQINNQIRYDSGTNLRWIATGNGFSDVTSPIGDYTVPHAITIRYDGSVWQVWRDGEQVTSQPAEVSGPFDFGQLGAYYGFQYGLQADVSEMIIYDEALPTADRQVIETYLQSRYQLP